MFKMTYFIILYMSKVNFFEDTHFLGLLSYLVLYIKKYLYFKKKNLINS
jgi:hypothetical protein